MLQFFYPITAKQLRDCAKNVFKKREKSSVSEMFSCELKFVMDICKKWFAQKIGSRFRELYLFTKQRYRRENPIKWEETKCCICDFNLAICNLKGLGKKRDGVLLFRSQNGTFLYQKCIR